MRGEKIKQEKTRQEKTRQEKIFNDDMSLNTCFFEFKKMKFQIVCTETGDTKLVKDSIDTVKNLATESRKKYTRRRLINLFKENNILFYYC